MAQFLSQIIWCGQHEGLEFVDRSRASPNDPSTRHGVHTQGFSVSVMSTRLMEAVATECFAGGSSEQLIPVRIGRSVRFSIEQLEQFVIDRIAAS